MFIINNIVFSQKSALITQLTFILPLIEKASLAISPLLCILNGKGEIIEMSEEFGAFLKLDKGRVNNIFDINPEMSFLSWSKMHKEKTNKFIELDSSCLVARNEVRKCKVLYLNIFESTLYFIIIKDLERPPIVDAKVDKIDLKTDHTFNYDDYAPNLVLYFDTDGHIQYSNRLASELKIQFDNISELFLESEIGPIMETVSTLEHDKEHLVRMIMRTNLGMKDGYSRISSFHENAPERRYRIEFLLAENIGLFDETLKEAMVELDRLSDEISSKNEIIIQDSISEFSFDDIITRSPRYKAVLRQVAIVADTLSTVLITGETGTGKEMLCNTLYKLSDRSSEIIVKINCATIPSNLIESILFGHEKGAFTDAGEKKIGKFELAHKGTIFLDEIGEMPYEMQAKLLRVLQEGEIERIGNPVPIKVDVRVIAATNRNLEQLIKEKKFREDLYYRLNVFPIYNIPLRERKEDIPLLVQHFIKKANKKTGRHVNRIKEIDMKLMIKHNYPGNVRELENIVERSVISSEGEFLELRTFLPSGSDRIADVSNFLPLEEAEKSHIVEALKLCNGKVTGISSAAELLQINGKTLVSKIKKIGINPKKYVT